MIFKNMLFEVEILLKIKLFFSTFLTSNSFLGILDPEIPRFVDSAPKIDFGYETMLTQYVFMF